MSEERWLALPNLSGWQVAEGELRLMGCTQTRRGVFAGKQQGYVISARNLTFWVERKYEFAVYVTNLPKRYNSWQIHQL